MTQQLLGVVGWSGSGKTTLLEFLVAQLCAKAISVNVVKHSHHDIHLEPPHKDSARLRAAGAVEVMLVSPYRYVIAHELRQQAEPSLAELLPRMQDADLILVEGYKWEVMPKLEVYRSALGKPQIFRSDRHILAVASDDVQPDDLPVGLVWLNLNQPEQVLAWLLAALQRGNLRKISQPG